jgi:hypothetical protein
MDERQGEYRRNIELAQFEASRALTDSERQSWLTLAASWTRLLDLPPLPQRQPQQQPQQKLGDNDNTSR